MKTQELFNRDGLIKLKQENVLTGNETSKKEIVIKLLQTNYSKNFIALVTNTHINYVYTINKQINQTK